MFNLYNFIFQRLIWKMISVYFLWFDYYWTLKEYKTSKVQNHSVSAYHLLQKWLVYLNFNLFTAAMGFFSSVRFLNMWKPRITFYLLWWAGPPWLTFSGSGLACLPSWLGMLNPTFIIFQGSSTKLAAFLLWQPTLYNQLLIQPLLLVPECYFS